MQNYINSRKAEILQTFDDCPVVLVEIMSANPEIAGKMVAISKNTGGYESLDVAIINYNLLEDDSLAIGITSKCIAKMEIFENQNNHNNINADNNYTEFAHFIENNFGCALAVFLSIILFIILCLIL